MEFKIQEKFSFISEYKDYKFKILIDKYILSKLVIQKTEIFNPPTKNRLEEIFKKGKIILCYYDNKIIGYSCIVFNLSITENLEKFIMSNNNNKCMETFA